MPKDELTELLEKAPNPTENPIKKITSEYEVIPPQAVAASQIIVDMWEKLVNQKTHLQTTDLS